MIIISEFYKTEIDNTKDKKILFFLKKEAKTFSQCFALRLIII